MEIVPRTSQAWVRFGYSGAGVCVYSRPRTRKRFFCKLQPSWSVRKSIWIKRTLTCPNVESVELRRRRPYSLFQIRQTSENLAKLEACRSRRGVTIVAVIALSRLVRLKRSSFLKMPGWHLRTWLKTSNVLLAVGWRVLARQTSSTFKPCSSARRWNPGKESSARTRRSSPAMQHWPIGKLSVGI